MTQFFLGMYQPEGVMPDPDTLGPIMQQMGELVGELAAKGALVFGNGFDQAHGTQLVQPDGTTDSRNFHPGSTQLGGVTIVDLPDEASAADVARRMAAITGLPIEVRVFAAARG